MMEIIKYGLLAIAICFACIFISYQIYGKYDTNAIITSIILGILCSYLIKNYYTNDKSDKEDEIDDPNAEVWITLQTIMNTDYPTEEYYGRRFNLTTGEILTKGDPKGKWIVATHLKNKEFEELNELASKIKPYSLTDENIIKEDCIECESDKFSLMISITKNNSMSILKSIIKSKIFTTNDKNCIKLTKEIEELDHLMPYWLTTYNWN